MPGWGQELAKLLIISGIILVVVGIILLGLDKFSLPLGKLPGDIVIKRGNFTFYFPVVTCLILSILLSLIFFIFRR